MTDREQMYGLMMSEAGEAAEIFYATFDDELKVSKVPKKDKPGEFDIKVLGKDYDAVMAKFNAYVAETKKMHIEQIRGPSKESETTRVIQHMVDRFEDPRPTMRVRRHDREHGE